MPGIVSMIVDSCSGGTVTLIFVKLAVAFNVLPKESGKGLFQRAAKESILRYTSGDVTVISPIVALWAKSGAAVIGEYVALSQGFARGVAAGQ